MLEIISSKVTAIPGRSGWVQIYDFTPEDPNVLLQKGQFFVVLAAKRVESEIDFISKSRELVSRLHKEYFGSSIEKPFDALKNSLQKVMTEFKSSWSGIEITCSAYAEGVVYSAAFGGSRVVISRDGALATILDSQDDSVIAASGYPKAGDKILLGTKTFFEEVALDVIKSGLNDKGLENILENGSGTSGALIMKFENKDILFEETKKSPLLPPSNNFEKRNIIKEKISRFFSKLPQKGIYLRSKMVDEATSQSRKLTFSVGIILLIILTVSIGFGIRQKKINDLKKKYQDILAIATQEVTQAINLASISPNESRDLFLDSEQKLLQIQALKVKDEKVNELQKKIEDSRAAILGEYLVNPELFLDLSLLSSGFKGDVLTSSGGQIFVLDKKGGRIVGIAVDTKKSKVVAGPSVIENPESMASYQDNVFVLFSDGIYDVGLSKNKVIEKTWSGGAFIYAFAGNIYVLDKDGNAIYRYAGDGNTFGGLQNWLSASTKVNFSEATSWGMNGAIYVLFPNAKILKYSLGSPQNFTLSGILPEIGNVDALSADPDNQYVYLLDKAGSRIVVVDKNGEYKAQYKSDQIAGSSNLVVSEAQKKIILLTGDKLYSTNIKHL